MIAVEPDQDSRHQQQQQWCSHKQIHTHSQSRRRRFWVHPTTATCPSSSHHFFPFSPFYSTLSFSLCCFLGKSTNNSERPFQPHTQSIFFICLPSFFPLSTLPFIPFLLSQLCYDLCLYLSLESSLSQHQ